MIPAYLIQRFGPTVAKVIFWGAIIALLVAVLSVSKCQYDSTAKTEIKLSKGQAGAAVASGSDAVQTTGNQAASETAADQVTRENADAIRHAEGADAPVTAAVRDAGLGALCRRAAYKDNPRCKLPR
jgi:hypothetical protein